MALIKSKGNMYDWVTHTHSHLRGKCPHGCCYCYVQAMEERYHGGHYAGDLRIDEDAFKVSYGSGKIIFIENCNDLFAKEVPTLWIEMILLHCRTFPDNTYVFQSKNPERMMGFVIDRSQNCMPPNFMIGTTVESDVIWPGQYERYETRPPFPTNRLSCLIHRPAGVRLFITVEPVMEMRNPVHLAHMIAACTPEFVNIGADSKGRGLREPSKEQLELFIKTLQDLKATIKHKINLGRLMK